MLMPKRTKRRKVMRGNMNGMARRGQKLDGGSIALQALEPAWIKANQIEAGRRCISRLVRKNGKLWIRIFPDKSVTKKPAETRQGGGKGNPEYWVASVRPGTIIFELAGLDHKDARIVLDNAARKLPIRTRIIEEKE